MVEGSARAASSVFPFPIVNGRGRKLLYWAGRKIQTALPNYKPGLWIETGDLARIARKNGIRSFTVMEDGFYAEGGQLVESRFVAPALLQAQIEEVSFNGTGKITARELRAEIRPFLIEESFKQKAEAIAYLFITAFALDRVTKLLAIGFGFAEKHHFSNLRLSLTVAAAVITPLYFWGIKKLNILHIIGFGLVIGGGLSNMADLVYGGITEAKPFVWDFLKVPTATRANFADLFMVLGTPLFLAGEGQNSMREGNKIKTGLAALFAAGWVTYYTIDYCFTDCLKLIQNIFLQSS